MLTTERLSPEQQTRKVHLNIPQLLWWLIRPRFAVLIWGRATGKTDGPTAMYLAECAIAMPRSVGRLAAYTYTGLLDNILPGVLKGWEQRYGWIEGMHYWVGKRPPEHLKIKKAYREPRGKPDHNIYIYNGSVIMLSATTGTINNGTEFDYIAIEEGRLNKKPKLDELVLAKRGNKDVFGPCELHQSVLIVSDRPNSQAGRWLIDYNKQDTPQYQQLILQLWHRIALLEGEIREHELQGQHASVEKKQTLINEFYHGLVEARRKCTMYSEASTLDNIHALGIETIEGFIQMLQKHEYQLSVLNIDSDKVVNGFYAALSDRHIHEATNYELWDETNPETRNCLADTDCNLDTPLHLAIDANAAINNVVTGQLKGDTIYVTSHLFVLAPRYIQDLSEKWCKYYAPHRNRIVNFHYNHTLIGTDSQGKTPDYQIVIDKLQASGFIVIPHYIGQALKHEDLYAEWNKCFSGFDRYLKWSMNANNTYFLRISMDAADIKYVDGKIKKDKKSERKNYDTQTFLVPPERATHASEAADQLMIGMQGMNGISQSVGGVSDPFFG